MATTAIDIADSGQGLMTNRTTLRFVLLALGLSATALASPSVGLFICACVAWMGALWSYRRSVRDTKSSYLRESALDRRDDS